MKCIYCNTKDNLTSSDIISFAITGAKLTKTFVCRAHNAYTNDNYEKRFIADLDFFRSELGLSTRDGKPIQFKADISVDGTDIHGVTLSNRRSLYSPKGVVSGTDSDGKKILMAPMEKLNKIKGGQVSSVNISNVTLHKTISSDDFVGFYAVHSVAKMAYEWHCYINGIEEYDEKYKNIVEYILGNNEENMVDIIFDKAYYTIADKLSEIGTNSFLEYDDFDGYKYVIFDLWKTIAYRVRICKASDEVFIDDKLKTVFCDMYLYRLDGSKCKNSFGVACLDGSESKRIKFATVAPSKVTIEKWKVLVRRIEKIMSTMVLSIHILKKKVEVLTSSLKQYNQGKIDIAELLGYEENGALTVLEVINQLYVNKEKYDYSKSFNENLPVIFNLNGDTITRTSNQKKEYVLLLMEMDKEGTLSEYIMNGITAFNEIYQIEMHHS